MDWLDLWLKEFYRSCWPLNLMFCRLVLGLFCRNYFIGTVGKQGDATATDSSGISSSLDMSQQLSVRLTSSITVSDAF